MRLRTSTLMLTRRVNTVMHPQPIQPHAQAWYKILPGQVHLVNCYAASQIIVGEVSKLFQAKILSNFAFVKL